MQVRDLSDITGEFRFLSDISGKFEGLLEPETIRRIFKEVDDKYTFNKREVERIINSRELETLFYEKQVNEYEKRLSEARESEVKKRIKAVK